MQPRHFQSNVCLTLLSGVVLLTSANLNAAIYKTTNAEGKTVYTDTPSAASGTAVEMPSNQLSVVSTPSSKKSLSEQEQVNADPASSASAQKIKAINYSAKITSPADGSTVFKAQQTLQIQASISPMPASGVGIRLLLDGQPIGSGSAASVDLMPMPRGQHTVGVQIISSSGAVLSEASSNFYLYQPSRLF